MTPEERKVYNEQYYANNKKRIADMMLKKVECPYCNRQVTFYNLPRHQTTQLCHRNRKNNLMDMEALKQQLDKLTQEINLLKKN